MKPINVNPALRVWGVMVHMPHAMREKLMHVTSRQVRVVVAAKSRAAAARAMGTTDRHLKEYGSVTSNAEEVALANARYPNASYRSLDSLLLFDWFDVNGDRVAKRAKR